MDCARAHNWRDDFALIQGKACATSSRDEHWCGVGHWADIGRPGFSRAQRCKSPPWYRLTVQNATHALQATAARDTIVSAELLAANPPVDYAKA